MSNNIYDILKKMQNLEAPKQSLTESKKSKPDYIDIDKDGDKKEPMKKAAREKSKGAVAEAVAQVEQQLAEKYQGFKNIDEGEYNEDMLSPGQKKIAKMSPPPNKIDANDLAALRAGKKKKAEGNAFSGAVAKAKASGQDEFEVGGKEYEVQEGDYKGDKPGQTNFKPPSPYTPSSTPDQERAAMYKKDNIPPELQANNSPAYQNWRRDRDEAIRKGEIVPSAKTNEGFPTVADAKKRMDDREGKTTHGKKTATATGTKHERDYDADEPTGERGRPKKDKFAK
jgi:hypothetical protein